NDCARLSASSSPVHSRCWPRVAPPPPVPAPEPPTLPTPPAPDVGKIPDAVPRPEPRSRMGNPPFYEVMGKRYHVLASSAGYLERGVASWYGKDFHGGKTSNGEKYDMYAMSAAHKTLPLPAYVEVTNLRNGRSVRVRVNDRGPFVANRIIDLSYTAASKLDMVRDGTALVEVRSLDMAGSGPAVPPKPEELYVQAGAFGEQSNANRLADRLRAAGIGVVVVRPGTSNGKPVYRVRVGPVPSVAEFDRVVADLRGVGVTDARLAVD
ncbi:MAG: septal ring lytic transglycosylase RlpA family protein, partial [Gammaproteobacteria bacterium]|nr:septal ring lytic transglycosylase RlpA family protein [Gammaproteobacteria bacterium]